MDRLDLAPRLAPPARLVGRVGRLDHHPLVAGRERAPLDLDRGLGVVGDHAGDAPLRGDGLEPGQPLAQRRGRAGPRRRRAGSRRTTGAAPRCGLIGPASSAPKRDIESWKDRGRPSSSIISVSPSSTTESDRERTGRGHHIGQAGGHVVEVAGEHRPPRRRGGAPGCGRRRASTPPSTVPSSASASSTLGGGGGEHRPHRPGPPRGPPPRAPSRPSNRASRAVGPEPPAEHVGAAHDRGRHLGGPGDGVDHHPFERALAQLADQQPPQEVGLGGRGPDQQAAEDLVAAAHRARPGGDRHLVEGAVEVGDGEARLGRRLGRRAPRRWPSRRRSGPGGRRR